SLLRILMIRDDCSAWLACVVGPLAAPKKPRTRGPCYAQGHSCEQPRVRHMGGGERWCALCAPSRGPPRGGAPRGARDVHVPPPPLPPPPFSLTLPRWPGRPPLLHGVGGRAAPDAVDVLRRGRPQGGLGPHQQWRQVPQRPPEAREPGRRHGRRPPRRGRPLLGGVPQRELHAPGAPREATAPTPPQT
ncbi:unnamed protein product, partial [Prorocentrum cordatum]